MSRYAKSISNYPNLLPDGKVTFLKAFNKVGEKYFGSNWHFYMPLYLLGTDKKMQKFLSNIQPLINEPLQHNNLIKLTVTLHDKYNGYHALKDMPIVGLIKDFTSDNHELYKLIGTTNELQTDKLKSLYDSIKHSTDKLNLNPKFKYPYFYRIIQYNVILNDILRILHNGKIGNKKACSYLLSRCGHITNIPPSIWLINDIDFSLNKELASFTEYNGYISETVYKGKILLDVDFINEYIDKITSYLDNKDNATQTDSNKQNIIKLKLPQISMSNTESWKDDVRMAFIDYYNEFGISPKPKKLCSFIQSMKAENNKYSQHIVLIKFNRPLTIINGYIKEEIAWDTFAKSITEAKKQILGK